ncbi:hypothetical protein FNF27_05244 [Cafeteria roenbergensis]|uniref:ER membrane protein complex subunit 6 n=1 Tax=Cafeteria roenbergensis TaxID=33653 RepID=A0A5A8DS10_CAFRO|nr:hypothetical protein FNF29_04126 [Cafeteria roenbergensis]KAA0166314.1 hypothetical protein FNF31_01538 [Cafeteria roenbergensis]KAA0168193.1 hypothetical protein FNF28_02611 [Cafeteria roenbergensis]KAA0173320.1 hypothetical protein FNF27_05244 [Cafeteria roenbergensis]|eukprot:KAA0152011.1 hypothetical protein FNF29_04126 [Cafeteria roenbergensis]
MMSQAAAAGPAAKPQVSADPAALRGNLMTMQYVNALVFIVAGLAVGTVGLEGLAGVAAYAVVNVALVAVLFVLTGGDTNAYFLQSPQGLFMSGFFGQISAFLLFWALAYSAVHVF